MAEQQGSAQQQPAAATAAEAPTPDFSAIYSGNLDWSDERAIGAAMAKAGLIEPEAIPDRDLNATLAELGQGPQGSSEEVAEATQPDTDAAAAATESAPESVAEGAAEPGDTAAAAAEVSPPAAPAADLAAETARLQKELDAANAKIAAIETVKQKTQTAEKRAVVLQKLIDELGEDHPTVENQKVINEQFDALEARLAEADKTALEQKTKIEEAQEATFHAAQMRTNKILGEITAGKPLDPLASPEAAMVKFFNDKRMAEPEAAKRTREQHYALVEADLKKHFPALAEKHYGKPAPTPAPKPKTAAAVTRAPTGIKTLSDIPGGAVEQPAPRSKGLLEIDPTKQSKVDFDRMMKDLTS